MRFSTQKGQTNQDVDMSVEDRYYTKKEYELLSPAKKLGLKRKRATRGHKPGTKSSKDYRKPTNQDSKLELSKRTIKAIASKVAELHQSSNTESSETEVDSDAEKDRPTKRQRISNNRSNPALQRPKKKD